jgi:two-component system, response regulator, stage 0 sporulation protein F
MTKILVVDDDSQVRRLVTTILGEAGHLVREASDGKEASEILGRWTPDILLTDIVMPRKEGIQLILEVRRSHPELCIIAMSGGAVMHPGLYLETAKEFGAARLIRKPFLPGELLRTIEEVCEGELSEPAE